MIDLSALRVHAQVATRANGNEWRYVEDDEEGGYVHPHGAYAGDEDTTLFIAACSPAVVLLLVEAVERAKAIIVCGPDGPDDWHIDLTGVDALAAALEPFTAGGDGE